MIIQFLPFLFSSDLVDLGFYEILNNTDGAAFPNSQSVNGPIYVVSLTIRGPALSILSVEIFVQASNIGCLTCDLFDRHAAVLLSVQICMAYAYKSALRPPEPFFSPVFQTQQ